MAKTHTLQEKLSEVKANSAFTCLDKISDVDEASGCICVVHPEFISLAKQFQLALPDAADIQHATVKEVLIDVCESWGKLASSVHSIFNFGLEACANQLLKENINVNMEEAPWFLLSPGRMKVMSTLRDSSMSELGALGENVGASGCAVGALKLQTIGLFVTRPKVQR